MSTPSLTQASSRLIEAVNALQSELSASAIERAAERQAYSRDTFCKAHAVSKSFYIKLRAAGLGPDEIDLSIDGKRARPRITAEAAAAWRKRMAQRAAAGVK